MPKTKLRRAYVTVPVRLGLGLLLCSAHYSCSNSKSMLSQDPFQRGESQLAQQAQAGAASQDQQATADSPSEAQQLASLQQSISRINSEEEARVRVTKEWPALPEKRVGLTPPESHTPELAEDLQLPVGGYERPLSEGDPWPVARTAQSPASQPPATRPPVTQTAAHSPTASVAPWEAENTLAQRPSQNSETNSGDSDPFFESAFAQPEKQAQPESSIEQAAATQQATQSQQDNPWADSPAPQTQASQATPPASQDNPFESFAEQQDFAASQNAVKQVSHQEQQPFPSDKKPAATPPRQDSTSEFSPAESRIPIQPASHSAAPWGCPPGQMAGPTQVPFPGQMGVCPDCDPRFYPDEYICDGGDRGYPVHYGMGTREGLDTQDTIVEYQDDSGKQRVMKTNEVCTYAPRFGSVRMVTGSSENVNVDRALGSHETVQGVAFNTRLIPNQEQQNTQLNTTRVRSRPSGLETEDITLGMNQATKVGDHTKLENTNTNYGFAGQVALNRAENPISMDGIQAAAVWTRKQSPVVVANDVGGAETYSWFRPEELVGREDKSTPGRLHVEKSADRRDAQPGDIITFTIRYKNSGDRSLRQLQIIDNLTPRLEYLDGTATSDRAGRLVVEDNQEGSLILKWEIAEELPGRSTGTVTFQARVR